jgi:hypothetical protein
MFYPAHLSIQVLEELNLVSCLDLYSPDQMKTITTA